MSPIKLFGISTIVGCLSLGLAAPLQDAGQVAPAPRPPAGQPAAAKTPPAAPAKPAGAAPAVPGAPAAANRAAVQPAAKPTPVVEMQTYYVAILRHGPKWIADGQPGAMVMSKQHGAHVAQLANLGVLVLAGDCGEQAEATDPYVALCVLSVPTLERATKLIDQDPAVIAGHLRAEIMSWVGPKGLGLRPSPAPAAGEGATATAPGAAAQPGAAPGNVAKPETGKPAPAGGAPAGNATAPKPPAQKPKPAPPAGAPPAGAVAPKLAPSVAPPKA